MKIGVISDSHGVNRYIDRAMKNLKDVDLIIHAGDNFEDAQYIEKKYKVKVIAVSGNCDLQGVSEKVEVIQNKRFYITHGHQYGVKTTINRIFYAGKENNADIVIYGHSHIPAYIVQEEMILLNPGSISLPRGGSKNSYCIIEVQEDIKVDFINI